MYLVRINLSHVELEDIEKYIFALQKCNVPIAIDTEGSQIRTGNVANGTIDIREGDPINIYRSVIECDSNNIYLRPYEAVGLMKVDDLIEIGFEAAVVQVVDVSPLEGQDFIKAKVITSGGISSNKGVHCNNLHYKLPPFSRKDVEAIKIARKHDIKYFTLSFMSNVEQVDFFTDQYPKATKYAKIETAEGVKNASDILSKTEGILIDRADLSREVPAHEIRATQSALTLRGGAASKEVFVASHILDTMTEQPEPTRTEIDGILQAIAEGATGFVLSRETAIGAYPVKTVETLNALSQQARAAAYEESR